MDEEKGTGEFKAVAAPLKDQLARFRRRSIASNKVKGKKVWLCVHWLETTGETANQTA